MLADPGQIPDDTAAFLGRARTANDAVDLRVFGGDAAVSQTGLDAYLRGEDARSDEADEESEDQEDEEAEPTGPSEYPAIEGSRSDDLLIAASSGRTCMVRLDCNVTCWGRNGLREQLSASSLTDVVAISSGEELATLIGTCPSVRCTGTGPSRAGAREAGASSAKATP